MTNINSSLASAFPHAVSFSAHPFESREVGEQYMLHLESGEFIKVSATVLNVLKRMDGQTPLDHVVRDLTQDGFRTSREDVVRLIDQVLIPNGLVSTNQALLESKASSPPRLWFHLKLIDGHKLRPVSKPFVWLFEWPVVLAAIVVFLLSQISLFLSNDSYFDLWRNLFGVKLTAIFPLMFLGFLLHEFGHIVSCFRYGISPRDVGIGLYLYWPVFYVDMSEAWLLNRRARMVTNLGGVYFQFLYFTLLSVWASANPTRHDLVAVLLLGFVGMVQNLNPTLRLDGYWLLTDYLDLPNVHTRIWTYLRLKIGRQQSARVSLPNLTPAAERMLIAYGLLYGGMIILMVIVGVNLVMQTLAHPEILIESWYAAKEAVLLQDWGSLLRMANERATLLATTVFFLVVVGRLAYAGFSLLKSRFGR